MDKHLAAMANVADAPIQPKAQHCDQAYEGYGGEGDNAEEVFHGCDSVVK